MASSKGSKKGTAPKGVQAAPLLRSKWVVVQLTSLGEREKNIHLIERAVHLILKKKDLDVFIPAISQKGQDDSLTTWYSNGYIFVRHVDGIPYINLQDTVYFADVLSKAVVEGGSRKYVYSLLEDKDLDPMRVGVKNLRVMEPGSLSEDDHVKVVRGSFKNLVGKVSTVYDDRETVQIFIKLRSKEVFMDFPSSYLQKVDE